MERYGEPYLRAHLEDRYDAIVVGSGLGGLATAALLAKHGGRRVVVLERHYTPGGFTHTFRRPGFEWDVGVHYVGEVHRPESAMARMFRHLTEGRLAWHEMGPVYDRILIGDDAYDFRTGRREFAEGLKRSFPNDAAGIDGYLEALRETVRGVPFFFMEKALPPVVSWAAGSFARRGFLRSARRTTREVLGGITRNPRLAAVLAGQYGDYGLPPALSSFGIHAVVANHYLNGGAYPVGGASAIGASIAPLIEKGGGKVLFNAEVQEVLVEGSAAVGVRMGDGRVVRAPVVVSGAGVETTVRRLFPPEVAARFGLDRILAGLEPSLAHMSLYVGLRGTDGDLGLETPNLWIYPGEDHDALYEGYRSDPARPFPVVYVSFPSAKDPTFARRCPGHSTIELVTFAPYERFARWAEERWRRRGTEYEELKERLSERLLEVLYEHVPSTRGRVALKELSTPVSTRHFANYAHGEIYGVAHTPARFENRALRPRTGLPGFYLTGQDISTCGVGGALVSGFLTASVILRTNLLSRLG